MSVSGAPSAGSAVAPWYRDPKVVAVAGGTGLALTWFGADVGNPATQVLVCWSILVVQAAALVWTSDRVLRLLHRRDPARRFWWTIRGACVLFTIGDGVQLVRVVDDPDDPAAAIGGAAHSSLLALGTAWIVLVMLRYPTNLRSRQERIRFWLDIATVVSAVAAFGWYFAVPDAGFGPGAELLPGVLTVLQGPVALLVAAVAVAKLLIAGSAPFCRVAGIFAGVTAVTGGVARVLGPALVDTPYMKVFFAVTVLGPTFTLAGVLAHERCLRSGAAPSGPLRSRPYSTLPYAAMAAAYGLLVVVMVREQLDPRAWGVLIGASASAALVVVRQLAAFAENARLLARLRTALAERDALADVLRKQAYHDSLTGLANRALLHDRLQKELDSARRQCRPVVVMLIDLDDFKPVNDRLGHHVGDLLLREVGGRLRRSLPATATVARFGGDEFAIVLCPRRPESVAALAERLVADLEEPYELVDQLVQVHASVGIAIDPNGSLDVDEILRRADAAMYAAKRQGKGTFAIVQPSPDH